MTIPTESEVLDALRQVMDPELGRNLVELTMVRDVVISPEGAVSFTLALTIPTCPMRNRMAQDARAVLAKVPGVTDVQITFGAMSEEERRDILGKGAPELPKLNAFNRVSQVIPVMSGKGGGGKSSVTALLAANLARRGQKVGILDADITGPSIPKLFGLPAGGRRGSEQGMLPAVTGGGIRVVSTNLLLRDEAQAVVWRGPMISATIRQFWTDTLWGKLDTLLVDLPPGTSDAALGVLQNLPVTGVVLVTTPQDLSALVVRKAIQMIRQLNIPILGVVENMSYFRCPATQHEHAIFGPSHADVLAQEAGAPVAARLPIDPQIAALCDAGQAESIELEAIQPVVDLLLQPA